MAKSDLGDLKPVYLIYGDEELLLERAVRRLRERLSKVADLDFNFDVFDGESARVDEILAAANTLPFMSERRLVVVRDADRMPSAALNAFADYASNPSEQTVLVLVAKRIAKNTRLYKAIEKTGQAFEWAKPKRGEYPVEVTKMFAARGRKVSPDAAEVLVRAVGRDLRRLESEVEKIVAYCGDRTSLSAEDLEMVMAFVAPASVFDLTDALGARDCAIALRLVAVLAGQGESVHGLHAMAVRHVRSLLAARALLDRGMPTSALMRELAMPDWQARKVAQQAQRFATPELVGALAGLAAAEFEMKTSRSEPRLILERWMVSMCGERQVPA
jgi:DNA polymerase-3 subunit delta